MNDSPAPISAPTPAPPPNPPAGSSLTLTHRNPGVTAHLPPLGLKPRALIFLGMALVFLLGIGSAFVHLIAGLLNGSESLSTVLIGSAGLIFALLAVVFIGGYAIVLITERAEIDLIDQTLLITRQDRIRLKQYEFTADQLIDVSSSSYNPSRENPHIRCLAVTPREGKTLELFLNRTPKDLEYLVELIHSQIEIIDDEDEEDNEPGYEHELDDDDSEDPDDD